MTVLLVGCTGCLGGAIIYKYLICTTDIIYITIRKKHNKSIKRRLKEILNSIMLSYKKYKRRIKLIEVTYDNYRNIVISDLDKIELVNNCQIIINALADINFDRPLKKAALNNTVTALNWLRLFQQCKRAQKYIYVSTAYVNFHRQQEGNIEEQIYESDMSETTLQNILQDKHTSISSYMNTYCYTKQLTEIILKQYCQPIHLTIIRPSIIIPAIKYPYPGWCKIQTISLGILGVTAGLLTYHKCKYHTGRYGR